MKKKLISRERVDILPGYTRRVYLVDALPTLLQPNEIDSIHPYCAVVDIETAFVSFENSGRQTYSIYAGDPVGEYEEDFMAEMDTQEVSAAFEPRGDSLFCPLCEKEYSNTPQGETWLRKHMESEHNTQV